MQIQSSQENTLGNNSRSIFTLLIVIILLSYLGVAVYSHSVWADNLPTFLSTITVIQILVLAAFIVAPQNEQFLTARNVFILAVIVHIIGIAGQPLFEDDYFRYLWDAYTFYTYGSPYGLAPESFFSDESIPEKFQNILSYINNPDLPTVYGPTLQYSFLLAYLIEPGNIFILQSIYALANLLIIAICLQFAKPKYVLLYVFSPLIFKEILLTAHPDGFAVALLMAALWARYKQYYFAVGALLGLSIGAKVFAILFIPFLLLRQPVKVILGLTLSLAILYMPILKNGNSDLLGLAHMADGWEFNSALWGLLNSYFSTDITRLLCMLVLLIILGGYGLRFYQQQKTDISTIPRGDIIFGSFLICAPIINPWYIVWLLPFAVIRPTITAWFAGFIVLFSYITPIYWPALNIESSYNHPFWLRWFEFGSLLLVFLSECYFMYTKRFTRLQ